MPTTRVRPDPRIPDHEVLRRIGGGAYGEVWLARGVTGALRAVKVLWRQDFEDERSFEREFEGILKYEPISRDHPGLVNVLHVGRSEDETSFYYYVMELGDDVTTGGDINPIEYEARTLRSDVKRGGGRPLDIGFCLEVGQLLAEGLHHLHELGLAHRDVKPSNVIFVNGKAKLADIGLVAARGQRTFVGTEGFVPPEGPGSARADVYSLGKVLYEVATGKDRLDFPELPESMPADTDRRQWLALNHIICEVCEPHVSRRTIGSAGELAKALEMLRKGKRRRRRKPIGGMLASLLLGCGLAWAGWQAAQNSQWAESLGFKAPGPPADPVVRAFLKVTSTPDGADVIEVVDEESGAGDLIGITPTEVLDSFVGEEVSLRILREGYQPYEVTVVVPSSAAEEPLVISAALKVYSPPTVDEPWIDQLGEDYRPLGDAHESVRPLGQRAWLSYLAASGRPGTSGQVVEIDVAGHKRKVVATTGDEARAYCAWLVQAGIEQGYLTEDHEAVPCFVEKFPRNVLRGAAKREGWRPFRVLVRQIQYGRIMIASDPPGAELYLDGVSHGSGPGPVLIERIRPGMVELTASLEGYKSETRRIELKPSQTFELVLKLMPNKSVVLTEAWENSLGMQLVPVANGLMASAWETRRSDFRQYAEATGERMPPPADWPFDAIDEGDEQHPVVSVSRDEAEAFCRWLTEKEQDEDRLTRSLEYRLPTDEEWTRLAGLDEFEEYSPAKRDQLKPRVPFWGEGWPPPKGAGNLGEMPEFEDGHAATAPVGTFAPNEAGLHDLCGNAQEWVSDSYSGLNDDNGVLRGGGWRSALESNLYVGSRNPQPPDAIDPSYGFRVVLSKKTTDVEEVSEEDQLDEEKDGSDSD